LFRITRSTASPVARECRLLRLGILARSARLVPKPVTGPVEWVHDIDPVPDILGSFDDCPGSKKNDDAEGQPEGKRHEVSRGHDMTAGTVDGVL
jgi:hypothetical protein